MTKTVTLFLTESCNLSCVYCYEHHKTNSFMSFEKACEIIDYELSQCDGYEDITFELFGGEPFLAFGTVKKIIDYLKSKCSSIPYRVTLTTNGTLVHGEIQEWLIEHKSVIGISLSLDGNAKMHNINRNNSFSDIDIDFFREYSLNPRVKMTISNDTICDLATGVIFLHQNGFAVDCNLAFGIDWEDSKYLKILDEQLSILIDYYLEHREIEPCSILSMNIDNVLCGKVDTVQKWCGTGVHMKAYGVDGTCYPCQFFSRVSIGEKALEYKDFNIGPVVKRSQLFGECIECLFSDICPSCYGSSYNEYGDFYKKGKGYCNLTKLTILANSYFVWRIISMRKGELTDRQKTLLAAVLKIQRELKNDPIMEYLNN